MKIKPQAILGFVLNALKLICLKAETIINNTMPPIHILPVNDLKPHTESSTCECIPEIDLVNGEIIITHNSFDKREFVERLTDNICEN